MIGVILFSLFFVFLFLGLPVGFAIGVSSLAAVVHADYPLTVMSQRMFTAVDSFSLMAIPLFMLAGALMSHGGITKRIIDFALCFVGPIRGGLAMVVAITGIIMGGISGSGVADAAAIGAIMVPEMTKRKYEKSFSGALCACCGSIGLIIPPSIAIIIYACTANVSIGDLFMAAYAPGICIGLGFLIFCYVIARIKGYPKEEAVSRGETWRRFKNAIWALLMPLIIVFGIRGGIFTATEGAVVAVVYSLVLSLFFYRSISWRDLPQIFKDSAELTGIIIFLIGVSSIMSWVMAFTGLPGAISDAMLSISNNRYVILIIINILLLIVGTFMDMTPACLIFTPIFLPICQQIGMNSVHFGIMMIFNLCIGTITPPVGTTLFVGVKVGKTKIENVIRPLLLYFAAIFFVLLLVTYIPALSMWLPGLLGYV